MCRSNNQTTLYRHLTILLTILFAATAWIAAGSAWAQSCGDPGAGDCCSANGTPGCEDEDCCNTVCDADAFCCDSSWDSLCAGQAETLCGDLCVQACCFSDGTCQDILVSECTDAGGTPQGEDTDCDSTTCPDCTECGGPDCGDCCSANGTPFCNDEQCCNAVCAQDSFCCNNTWDGVCADQANDLCTVCGALPEACCFADGSCQDLTGDACLALGGTPQGEDTDCDSTTCPVAPPNDDCEDRIEIFDGDTAFDTTGATTDGMPDPLCESFGGSDVQSDIWFNYTATCTGSLTVSTCDQADYDTKIAVYEGCDCPATNIIGCNDDGTGCAGFTSELTVPVTVGTCYKIRVGGFGGAQGSGTLTVTCTEDTGNPACPGMGSCCSANGTPGCEDEDCCNTVCDADPFCCDTSWDGLCADQAEDLCGDLCVQACCFSDGTCQDIPVSDCTDAGGTPQGEDTDCDSTTCPDCTECGGPDCGDCCSANGTPFCNDEQCCNAVCAQDSFCCNNTWDQFCADQANDICTVCGALPEACCFADGSCQELVADACVAIGGDPQGLGTDCSLNDCDAATGDLVLSVDRNDSGCVSDDQFTVTLSMENLSQNANGFQAFLTYDDTVLDFNAGASSYTASPFNLHITPIMAAEIAPGMLQLDGSDDFNGPGTAMDSDLAFLVFDVLQECAMTSVDFDPSGLFESELSFGGFPFDTTTINTQEFTLDSTPPMLMDVPMDMTFECDDAPDVSDPENTGGLPTATDNCTMPQQVTFEDMVMSDPEGCMETFTLVRTFTATDACGNSTSAQQVIEVVDSTPPVITDCPEDITVIAEAGGCSAQVFFDMPMASDNCELERFACGFTSGSVFPSGTTTVACVAKDCAGNVAQCLFDIEVLPVNEVSTTVTLDNVDAADAGGSFTRCIKFVAYNSADCNISGENSETLTFTGNPATATATIEVPCGDYDMLCAKDEQHTLWDTVGLTVSGTTYTASPALVLEPGDNDNDGDVDINDVTLLIAQFGMPATPPGGCPVPLDGDGVPVNRDADFSNNGVVGSEDFSILSPNFQEFTSCDCTPMAFARGGVFETAVPADRFTPEIARKADLDNNGVIDWRDVQRFEREHGLTADLSSRMRR